MTPCRDHSTRGSSFGEAHLAHNFAKASAFLRLTIKMGYDSYDPYFQWSDILNGPWAEEYINHGDRKSPRPGAIPFPNGRNLWLINGGGDPIYLRYLGAHPPSRNRPFQAHKLEGYHP